MPRPVRGRVRLPRKKNGRRRRPRRSSSGEEGEGIEVRGITSGSLAKKIGVQTGDRILRIGAKTMERRTDISRAINGLKTGEEFEIEVLRTKDDGSTKTLVLKASFEKSER